MSARPSVFRDRLLEGKVAFISGGGSGINLAIAKRYAEHGAKVALLGRTKEKLDAAVEEIAREGGIARAEPADVRDAAAVKAALQNTRDAFGELDLVVCGAAGNFPSAAIGMSPNAFKSVVDIDLLGTFNVCRLAFEHLRKPGASVLNISAGQAFAPAAFQSHVCAAKAGVDMITRVLAIEWGPEGVRVNSIAPGPIEGTEGMARITPDDESRKRLEKGIPLGRYGRKDEIADLALFLASPAAAYITGAVMVCDGGQSLNGFGQVTQSMLGG